MKERITVTIERTLLKTIDASVDGVQIKNRSHAIELFVERGLKHVLPSKAVILAGGDPRILLKIVNGKAVIAHNIELLATYGVTDVIVITDKRDTRVKDYLGDGAAFDVHVTIIEEREPMGTAGCLNLVRDQISDHFILMNGDELKAVNLKEMFAFHKQHHGTCTIALTNVQDPSGYGVAIMNGTSIVGFIEKPTSKNPPSTLISAGLYMMAPEVFSYVPKGYAKLETDVFPKLARQDLLVGYPFSGQYLDIQPGVAEKIGDLWRGIIPNIELP